MVGQYADCSLAANLHNYSPTLTIEDLSQIVHLDKIAGRYKGSKSLVAAPLWAEKFYEQPEGFRLRPYNIEETQTLHQQGFASLMPACNSPE